MGEWEIGKMECWKVGVMEKWNDGRMGNLEKWKMESW